MALGALMGQTSQGIPSGCIVMWSGAVNAIPSGWLLCDGSNNTPDLRGRFIVGAGGAYNVGDTGGNEQVTLTIAQMPSHRHDLQVNRGTFPFLVVGLDDRTSLAGSGNQALSWRNSGTKVTTMTTSGSSQPHENRPPYYALCYIMKS